MGLNLLTLGLLLTVGLVVGLAYPFPSPHGGNDSCKEQRIGGGCDAKQGQLPYQLSLQSGGGHFCGASLTEVQGHQIVITAAHCVSNSNPEGLHVIAGDLNITDSTGLEQVRNVYKITVHERYESRSVSVRNDIAILFLDSEFFLSENVRTIKLPPAEEEPTGNLTISGWGLMYGERPPPEILQYVDMPVVDHDECKEKWKHHPQYPMEIGHDVLCSGVPDGDKSPCYGDSGGPAARGKNDDATLVGIVSFGDPSCRSPEYPAGFTKVSCFIEWIEENVAKYAGAGRS